MSNESEKGSMAAGIFSVVIMSLLTAVGIYGFTSVNNPSHYDMCGTEGPAKWVVWFFYFSTFGGGIGAVYELYLVIIGKVFEVQTIPIVPRIRGFNAGYIFTVGLIFDVFMVIGSGNAGLLNSIVFFLAIAGTLIAPGMAFPGTINEKVGQAYFGGTTVLSMLFILIKGSAFGGALTKYFLALNKASSAAGAILTPPNKSLKNNIQFHILRLIANILVIIAYFHATSEAQCFPQEAEANISSKFLPILGASVVLGWIFHVSVSKMSSEKGETLGTSNANENYGTLS